MGTRTYSRRSSTGERVLTAEGRRRAGLEAINILGEAAPTATVTERTSTFDDVRMMAKYNEVMDTLEPATDLELSGYSQSDDSVLALAAARRLSTRRWSETNNYRLQDAENRFPEVDPIKTESDFGLNVQRLAGAAQVFSDYVGDYMTGPGARQVGDQENIRDLLVSTPRAFSAMNSFLESVYDMQRKARRDGRKKFNKKEREELNSLMGRVRGRLADVQEKIDRVSNDNAFNQSFDQPTVRDVFGGRTTYTRPLPEMKTYARNLIDELGSAIRLIETGMSSGSIKDITNF